MKLKNIEVGKKYQLKAQGKRKEVDYFISPLIFGAQAGTVVTVEAVNHDAETLNVCIKCGYSCNWVPAQWLKRIKEEV